MNNNHSQARKTLASAAPAPHKPTIADHPELAREIIHRLVKSEDWARTNAAQWSMETIKHIALFCATGMAGSFAAMQIPKISSPIWHSMAGVFFFIAFALCVYRMHRTAIHYEDISRSSKKQFENALWDRVSTLEDICHQESEHEKRSWDFVIRLGWVASGFAVAGTVLLLAPIVLPQLQRYG